MGYRWWGFIALFLFGAGLVIGLATPPSVSNLLAEEVAALGQMAKVLAPLPRPAILILIFLKNVSAVLLSFALSPVLCLTPVIALVVNGWLLGLVSVMVIEEKSVGYLLAGLLPHGIFEVPALIIGEAVALSFGSAVLSAVLKKKGREALLPSLRQNLRYLVAALMLFLPAAIIETYVTPLFIG